MNALMVNAIISLLLSFGVDQNTANNIRSLITPPQATSTPAVIIPVTVTPVIENQPIYFGSTQPTPLPVNNPPQVILPVVQLPPMDNSSFTIEKMESNSIDPLVRFIRVIAKDTDGTIISGEKETATISVDGDKVPFGTLSDKDGNITGHTYEFFLNQTDGKIVQYKLNKPDSVVVVTYHGKDYTVTN